MKSKAQKIAEKAVKNAGGKKIRFGPNRGKFSAKKAVKEVKRKASHIASPRRTIKPGRRYVVHR